jgi:hypothetical protein
MIFEESNISIAKSVCQITLWNDERSLNRLPSIIAEGVETIIKIHGPASPIAGSEICQFPSGPADSEIVEAKLCATNSDLSSKVDRNGCVLNS